MHITNSSSDETLVVHKTRHPCIIDTPCRKVHPLKPVPPSTSISLTAKIHSPIQTPRGPGNSPRTVYYCPTCLLTASRPSGSRKHRSCSLSSISCSPPLCAMPITTAILRVRTLYFSLLSKMERLEDRPTTGSYSLIEDFSGSRCALLVKLCFLPTHARFPNLPVKGAWYPRWCPISLST